MKTIEEQELITQQADFWNDPKEAEKILKGIKSIKVWTDSFESVRTLADDFEVLYEFLEAGEDNEAEVDEAYVTLLKSVEELEFKKMLSNEEDQLSAIIEINPGAGGTESNDWAEMLMRMYLMWGEKNKYKVLEVFITDHVT